MSARSPTCTLTPRALVTVHLRLPRPQSGRDLPIPRCHPALGTPCGPARQRAGLRPCPLRHPVSEPLSHLRLVALVALAPGCFQTSRPFDVSPSRAHFHDRLSFPEKSIPPAAQRCTFIRGRADGPRQLRLDLGLVGAPCAGRCWERGGSSRGSERMAGYCRRTNVPSPVKVSAVFVSTGGTYTNSKREGHEDQLSGPQTGEGAPAPASPREIECTLRGAAGSPALFPAHPGGPPALDRSLPKGLRLPASPEHAVQGSHAPTSETAKMPFLAG